MTIRRPPVLLALVVPLLVLAGCGDDGDTATPTDDAPSFAGYTRDPAPSVAEVDLPAASGDGTVDLVAGEAAIRVVYFGYTSCPDVCPTTMSDLKRARLSLPEDQQDRVEFVMVTVDPDRDVPEKLDAYVTTFLPDGHSARTEDPEQLRRAAEAFGADYSVSTAEDGEIEVSHTAELYAVDDTGHVVLQWPFGVSSEDLGRDLATLLDAGSTA